MFLYAVTTVIIDALGTFHYLDMCNNKPITDSEGKAAPGAGTDEFVLVNVLTTLLESNRVAVFVSKSGLYDEEKLPVKWPFTQAGVPSIPRDFMPSSWASLVSHCVLLYRIQQNMAQEGDNNAEFRGVVGLVRTPGQYSRQLQVAAASTLRINDNGISEDDEQIHVLK